MPGVCQQSEAGFTRPTDPHDRLCYRAEEVARILKGASALTIWRERAGLTQRALAEAASVSPSYLAEIEGGKKPGSATALLQLARVLRVPVEYLIAGSDHPEAR